MNILGFLRIVGVCFVFVGFSFRDSFVFVVMVGLWGFMGGNSVLLFFRRVGVIVVLRRV